MPPRSIRRWAVVVASMALLVASIPAQRSDRDWPAVTFETRPWTRWWWHGSAVDPRTLTAELETLKAAGIGGVEVTPIYGVRGAETRFIPYLSSDWMRVLEHTAREGARLDIGIDMATGTGWPFGGPWVGDEIAARTIAHRAWVLESGQQVNEPIRLQQAPFVRAIGNQIYEVTERKPGEPPAQSTSQQPLTRSSVRPIRIEDLAEPVTANRNLQALALEQVRYPRDLPLIAVVAYGPDGQVVDVSGEVDRDRTLAWTAPQGRWVVYALFGGWHGKLVERAAPGGEGYVIDHFSRDAIRAYLARFDRAFGDSAKPGIRAFFNDSYEVDDASGQADWSPRMIEEFRKRRGYDLLHHLPALFGRDGGSDSIRVLADYRETISDLLLETFTTEWAAWSRRRGAIVRNQAHGSPANLLDLYAASDIPETEGLETPRFKWAVSAAHVAGRRLVAAETATWLGEHFRTTLADVRAAIDHFFASGVNHIVYHGTAYSPADEPWPGWQFYASVDFSRWNAWWDDFAALNRYVMRAQSFLQSGRPDHDVLLYFPFYEAIAIEGKTLLTHFGGANRPSTAQGFESAANLLETRGFTYDYISDRQVLQTRVVKDRLITGGGGEYRTLVIPVSRHMPIETLEHVHALAQQGATIVLCKDWPLDATGLRDLEERRQRLRTLTSSIDFGAASPSGVVRSAGTGRGRVLVSDDVEAALTDAGVLRERLVDQGLQFARRIDEHGRFYFVVNRGNSTVDGWIPIETRAAAVTLFDPMHGRRGAARVRPSGASAMEVYVQLPPGQSLIVATSARATPEPFVMYQRAGRSIGVPEPWAVRFLRGGPALPSPITIDRLASWTTFGGSEAMAFSGSATYTSQFLTPSAAPAWELNLGRVHESARVRLNGRDVGTLLGPPYTTVLDGAWFKNDGNILEITVTNLSANRIAALDRSGTAWKKFYNVNFPARLPANRGQDGLFTAAAWEPLDSGLLGPVTLTPLSVIR